MSRLEVDSDVRILPVADASAAAGALGIAGGQAVGVATAMSWVPLGSGDSQVTCVIIATIAAAGNPDGRIAPAIQLTYDDVYAPTPPVAHEHMVLFAAASASSTIASTTFSKMATGVRMVLASSSVVDGGVRFIVRKGRGYDT